MLKNAVLLLLLAGASFAWWDASFPYRTPITITNSGSNLTDYQVRLSQSIYNTTGLVGSWHFSEGSGAKAADSSGLGNDGTLLAGAVFATGKSGNGIRLDGIEASASVADSASLNITDAITLEVWVNATSSSQTDVTVGFRKDPSASKGTLSNGGMVFSAGSGYSAAILNKTFAAGENFKVVSYWAHDYRGLGMVYGPSVSHLDWTGWSFDPVGPFWAELKYTGFPSGYSGSCFCQYHAPITGGGPATTPYYFKHERSGNTISMQYSTTSASGPWTNFNGLSPITISSSDKVVLGWGEASGTQVTPLTLMQFDAIVSKGSAYGLRFNGSSVIGKINANGINASFSPGWNHIALTYDRNAGSAQQKLYVNGALAAQGTLTEAIILNSDALKIGTFNGTIDEVRIYNRSLPAQEISEHYTAKARPDYADIRFTWLNQSSGAEQAIPYWMENDKTAWARVPYILAGSSEINVYYGNATATYNNSAGGNNTFDLFDDFGRADSATVGNGWSEQELGSGNNIAGGKLKQQSSGSGGSMIYRESLRQNNLTINSKFMQETTEPWTYGVFTRGTTACNFPYCSNGAGFLYWYAGTWNPNKLRVMDTSTMKAEASLALATTKWYNSELRISDTNAVDVYIWAAGAERPASPTLSQAAFTPAATGTLLKIGHGATGTLVGWTDDIIVRKYASTEPTSTFGTEQQPDTTPPSVLIQSPNSTPYTTNTVPVNFTATDDAGVSSCTVRLNGTVNSSTCGNYTLALGNGAYILNVSANDTSGNENSSQVSFTVAVPSGQQANTTQANTGSDGIAAGTIGFAFTPTSLAIQAGGQTASKAIAVSADVNRITVATRITLQGQPVQNKQVTYTLSGSS